MKNLCPPLTKNTSIKETLLRTFVLSVLYGTLSFKKMLEEFPRCRQEC